MATKRIKMKSILLGILFICVHAVAQEQNYKGIRWIKDLSWEQIKEKAKKENKYIFVDCYTTWCGPCKKMDKEVYGQDSVGDFMNEKFINVRVQMDRTNNDNNDVIGWYNEAERIKDRYRVTIFPSYLFFSPIGDIIHRDVSYMASDKFVSMAEMAFNPQSQYYTLKAEYEEGRKDYSKMKYLVKKGEKFRDREFVTLLRIDYLSYLSKQPEKIVFTKSNIDFISSAIPDTKSNWFNMFYQKSKKVNEIMGQTGFARRSCDSAIAREYINPVLNKVKPGNNPNWDSIYSVIERKWGVEFANRNVTWRKAQWSLISNDELNYMKCLIQLDEMGGLDTSYLMSDIIINSFAYSNVFKMEQSELKENPEILDAAILMMERVVRRSNLILHLGEDNLQKDTAFTFEWKAMKIDTYASLLFKAGRKDEAIKWENEAMHIAKCMGDAINEKVYQNVINAMKSDSL
jgi:thioredoxin-related protein